MDIGMRVNGVMVAAAGAALLPAQEMTLRGSIASQSLTAAADAANEVIQVAEQVGDMGGGSKALETMGIQVATALAPMAATGIANVVRNACAHRHKSEPQEFPPPVTPETVHHRISSELSGEEGEDLPSVDFNNLSSPDTLEKRVNGFLNGDEANKKNLEVKALEKRFETEVRVNAHTRNEFRQQMSQIDERNKNILNKIEEILQALFVTLDQPDYSH